MGKQTWRWQETLLLEEITNSDKGRSFLAEARQGSSNWSVRAIDHYVNLYLARFSETRFPQETEGEFACRKARTPHAALELLPEESEEDRLKRLERIRAVSTRIPAFQDSLNRRPLQRI